MHKVIGPLVLEKKIFEDFLPYMGVAAIFTMWPRPCEQTSVPPSHWGSICLALIGLAILEKKNFENGGRWMEGGPWLYYKLTNEPKGELKSGEVLCYTLRTVLSVRPIRPSVLRFRTLTWVVFDWFFFKLCMDIDIKEEWFGVVNRLKDKVHEAP